VLEDFKKFQCIVFTPSQGKVELKNSYEKGKTSLERSLEVDQADPEAFFSTPKGANMDCGG